MRLRSIDLACVGYSFVSYSLGEYAALVIAGVFALDAGLAGSFHPAYASRPNTLSSDLSGMLVVWLEGGR